MMRRLLGGFLVSFLLVMSFSVDAYADSPSTANPGCYSVYTSQNDYLVYPVSNRFDATLVLLGMWHAKIQITQDMFVKLSNEDSGGHFYELASHFSDGYDPPSWADDATNPLGAITWLNAWTYISWNIGEPWEDFLWWVHAEDYEISQAKADLQTILDGGSLGSAGGGSGAIGNSFDCYMPFSFGGYGKTQTDKNYRSTSVYVGADRFTSAMKSDGSAASGTLLKAPFRVVIPQGSIPDLPSGYSNDNLLYSLTLTGVYAYFYLYLVDNPNFSFDSYTTTSTADVSKSVTVPVGTGQERYLLTLRTTNYVMSDAGCTFNVVDFNSGWISNNYSMDWTISTDTIRGYGGFGAGGGGDNHWPDPVIPNPPDPPDDNPEPDPDPPDPGPGIDLPDVDFPDVTIESPSTSVSFPTINIETPSSTVNTPSNTNPTDYTPWLSAILDALNSIIADLDSHCQHLRQAIRDYSQALANSINASMDSHCQHLRQAIKTYTEALASSVHDDLEYFYNDLTAYLAELAQWLVEHLNWSVDVQSPDVTVPSFDDSGIVAWLKRIYFKLGGTSQRKPDPITETGDALDWWSALLQWIANALSGFITTFVGDVGSVVQGVLTRFPFSIPWDILAYLTLLDAERVTPVIVVTVPAVTGWWSQFSVTIDLSAYNLAMATVRSMMLVWWGFVLVMRTDWILLVMGRTGAELATGFVSRLVGNGGD